MDHKDFASALPQDVLADLNRKTDRPGLIHLAGPLGLVTILGLWIAAGWPLWQVVLVARFIPVIAFNLINYAAGLTRIIQPSP